VILEGDAVDRRLDRRVEELDDEHEQHAADEERPLHSRGSDPERGRNEERRQDQLLPEGVFVAQRLAQAGNRVARCAEDAL